MSEINIAHEDVMMGLFVYSFEMEERDWIRHYRVPKIITSMALFFELFFKHWGPPFQDYKSALNDHLVTLQENKEDEVVETIEIEEALTSSIVKDQ